MDLKGKKIYLSSTEAPVSREELERRLAELGAQVVEPDAAPDAVLAGEVVFSVRLPDLAEQKLGVPMLPEAELYELLLRGEQAGGSFADHDALAAADDPAELLGLLREADWAAFAPERDLPSLREKLAELEREHGVTQAHRLAIVLPDGGGVDVHDEDGRRFHVDIDTTKQIGMHDAGPERPWAWEPSGEHGACLTADGRVEVWSLGDEPACVRSVEVPAETTAVLWGASGCSPCWGSTRCGSFAPGPVRFSATSRSARNPTRNCVPLRRATSSATCSGRIRSRWTSRPGAPSPNRPWARRHRW
ncbi:hypothetical protein AB0L13_00770 [Saccharopolyspora shandongensis]|uniref:hypothetical protein n=1 Tax=Saccharopolyspora shandongensis TaxID=418495 RepID=UPI00342C5C80